MADENMSLFEQLVEQKKTITAELVSLKNKLTSENIKYSDAQAFLAGKSCQTFCNGVGSSDRFCGTTEEIKKLQGLQNTLKSCTNTVPAMAKVLASLGPRTRDYDNAINDRAAASAEISSLNAKIKTNEGLLVDIEDDLANALAQSQNVNYLKMTPEELAAAKEAERKAKNKKMLITGGIILGAVIVVTILTLLTIKYYKKIRAI